jgi:ribosomal protein L11 methyltransferase
LKVYPAIDIRTDEADMLYAALDDLAPIAIEERGESLRAFFSAAADRDRALCALTGRFDTSPVDVPDDNWAERSQQDLAPVRVGRFLVTPRIPETPGRPPMDSSVEAPVTLLIPPSMGFGTGHHATTRLCLAALQTLDLNGKTVLDLGTGSGILAIAASRLGARAIGVDFDEDAVESATENVRLNQLVGEVSFFLADLSRAPLPAADVVVANLTGALLLRCADIILNALSSGGVAVLSGLMRHERDGVRRAFATAAIEWEREEDEWVGLIVKKS